MKTYEIILKPLSGFGTPLKGDTLFGHICWQAAYDSSLFDAPLDTLLSGYASSPFLVISSAYPVHRDNGRTCLLYTSDAADDLLCVDLGGRRIINKIHFIYYIDFRQSPISHLTPIESH